MINKDNQLVRIESQGDSEDSGIGAIDFSEWNAVEPFEMPADDEIFSIPGM